MTFYKITTEHITYIIIVYVKSIIYLVYVNSSINLLEFKNSLQLGS